MSLEEQQHQFHALNEWFLTEQGIKIAHAFFSELIPLQDILHGATLLQFGQCGDNLILNKLRFQSKWIATPYLSDNSALVTLLNQLPLNRESVDCILAPLTLEAFVHKNPIDEIDRVLKPLGYVIFFGINPISLWGYWLSRSKKNFYGISKAKSKSVFTIKRAMLHRGYLLCHLSHFYYLPPCREKKWLTRFEMFNELGKMIAPMPAGFYCLVAQKQQENLIGPILVKQEKIPVSAHDVSLQPG